ncbi:MAG: hypothetical protein J1F05_04250 [Muribaculaceae bacterium]|nr:hypothetical protein [Muribaculaceae bacterium]
MINILHIFDIFQRHPQFRQIRILRDFRMLHKKKGISLQEYIDFRLDLQPESFRQSFLGLNEQRYYLDYLNPIKYYSLARNKFLAHKIFEGTGIKTSKLYCYYQPEGKTIESDSIANDLLGVIKILKEKKVTECIIKATESSHGNNVYAVVEITYGDDNCSLKLHNNTEISLSSIIGKTALIFESMVRQTSQLASFNSSSVNTVRFMTALYPDNKARLVATFIKIGRAGACVDNAGNGGNVDACIDIDTGELKHAIRFDGWDKITDITNHPDSGARIDGVRIENWDKIVEDVLHFQECFPYIKVAGWDIAITDDGPVVIEVNDFWDRTGQYFIRRGWRNEIRNCYLAWKDTKRKYDLQRQPNKLSERQLKAIINK